MAALIRCGRLLGYNLGRTLSNSVFFKDVKPFRLHLFCNAREITRVAENKKMLPPNINRTIDNGHISRQLFSSLLYSFEGKDDVTENNIAMLLHICCSGPFDTSLNQRIQMIGDIWSRLDEFGVEPTTKLYNMKLKAYCANKKIFSPSEELTIMKSLGLNPDKVTYGLLIEGFNQNGDVTGANYVLETMKDANLNIGISTFNSFITGHLKSGSPQEAENTLELMRSKGLQPNVDTFFRYAEFFANEGNGNQVIEQIEKAQKNNEALDQSMLMSLYRTMLLSGYETEADKMLPLLTEEFFHVSSMHRLCQLASEGFSEEALHLYLTIPKVTARKDTPSAGCFLIHSMIVNGQDAKDVVEIADKLLEDNPSTTPHRYALLYAYRYKLTDQAIAILKLLMSKNYSMKIPYFIPAICQYRNAENLEGLYEVIAMMNDVDLPDYSDFIPTMSYYCYPALTKLGQDRQAILTRMKDHERQWNTFFLIDDLQNKSCAEAHENAKGKKLDENIIRYLRPRWSYFAKHLPHEWESCIKLSVQLTAYDNVFRGILGKTVVTVIEKSDKDTAEQMLKFFKKKKLRLNKEQIGDKNIVNFPQEIQMMLQELFESQAKVSEKRWLSLTMKEMMSKPIEELEAYVNEYPDYRLARVCLLKKHVERKDFPAAQQKLRELEASGFTFPRHELLTLIPMLLNLGDTDSALSYMKVLKEMTGTNYPDHIPLRIAVALLKIENVEDALTMIQDAIDSQMPSVAIRDRSRRRILMDLLSHAPTVKDAENIHKSLMGAKGFLSISETTTVHKQYVKKLLASDIDDEDLLQILQKLQQEYWVFPCMDEIITRFIEKQNKSHLKKVIDIGVSFIGGNLFYHKLACGFVRCGMPAKASVIFQSLKDRFNEKAILISCRYFIINKEIDCVESLVDITKSLPMNRRLMLGQLIEAYVAVDDIEKAFGVLQMFQDENISPVKSTLDFLIAALKTRNLEATELLKAFLEQKRKIKETEHQERSDSSPNSDLLAESSDQDTKESYLDATMSTETSTHKS